MIKQARKPRIGTSKCADIATSPNGFVSRVGMKNLLMLQFIIVPELNVLL